MCSLGSAMVITLWRHHPLGIARIGVSSPRNSRPIGNPSLADSVIHTIFSIFYEYSQCHYKQIRDFCQYRFLGICVVFGLRGVRCCPVPPFLSKSFTLGRSVVLAVLWVVEALSAFFGLFTSLYGALGGMAAGFGNFFFSVYAARSRMQCLAALHQFIRGIPGGGSGFRNFFLFRPAARPRMQCLAALQLFIRGSLEGGSQMNLFTSSHRRFKARFVFKFFHCHIGFRRCFFHRQSAFLYHRNESR